MNCPEDNTLYTFLCIC